MEFEYFEEKIQKLDGRMVRTSSLNDSEDVTDYTDRTPTNHPEDVTIDGEGLLNQESKSQENSANDIPTNVQSPPSLDDTLDVGSNHTIYFVDTNPVNIDHEMQQNHKEYEISR
jgi:hypothetical protein